MFLTQNRKEFFSENVPTRRIYHRLNRRAYDYLHEFWVFEGVEGWKFSEGGWKDVRQFIFLRNLKLFSRKKVMKRKEKKKYKISNKRNSLECHKLSYICNRNITVKHISTTAFLSWKFYSIFSPRNSKALRVTRRKKLSSKQFSPTQHKLSRVE